MTTVYTRTTTAAGASNQNAPLTSAQVDANFINLNADKAPLTGEGTSGTWGISITGTAATATNVAWSGVTSKPAVIAAGTTQAEARAAIGAGTGSSDLAIGTTASTAKAGDWAPMISDVSGLSAALDAKVTVVSGKGLSPEEFTAGEKSKLAGIGSGATANLSDSHLLDRSNHTGTQAISTITGLQDAIDNAGTVVSVSGRTGAVTLTSADVGLTNVDNTSDASKPVSTATATALNSKAPLTGVGASGTWPIDITGAAANVPWSGVTGKPAVIAEGATAADARTAIGAGTSDLALGVTGATALAGDTAFQPPLVSGTNIKTVNGNSLLGSGDLAVTAGISDAPNDGKTYGRKNAAWAEAAPLASPTFTGTPAAPTAAVGTNTTQLATTAYVVAERTAATTLTNKILTIPVLTGAREVRVAMPANAIDLSAGNVFTKTISGATTLAVSGFLFTGHVASFLLELTNAGSAAITWFSGVKWAGGTAPTLTAAGVDVLGFYSHDGGTTWRGMLLAKDSK